MKKISKQQLYDYIIIAARVSLGCILIIYGCGKLTGYQFGVSDQELNTPLKDLSLFQVSWYLADHQPFKSFIGGSQIIAGLLMIFRRTCIIGTLMSIPIWLNILVWDITFMQVNNMYVAFTFRLSYYLVLTFFILRHYRVSVVPIIRLSLQERESNYNYPWWAYLLLPALGIVILFAPLVYEYPIRLVFKL